MKMRIEFRCAMKIVRVKFLFCVFFFCLGRKRKEVVNCFSKATTNRALGGFDCRRKGVALGWDSGELLELFSEEESHLVARHSLSARLCSKL